MLYSMIFERVYRKCLISHRFISLLFLLCSIGSKNLQTKSTTLIRAGVQQTSFFLLRINKHVFFFLTLLIKKDRKNPRLICLYEISLISHEFVLLIEKKNLQTYLSWNNSDDFIKKYFPCNTII
jgi:hypothetical protein